LEEAAREFLKGGDRLGGIDAYQYDAVNLVRQVLRVDAKITSHS
jgi:hypothetical protein